MDRKGARQCDDVHATRHALVGSSERRLKYGIHAGVVTGKTRAAYCLVASTQSYCRKTVHRCNETKQGVTEIVPGLQESSENQLCAFETSIETYLVQ